MLIKGLIICLVVSLFTDWTTIVSGGLTKTKIDRPSNDYKRDDQLAISTSKYDELEDLAAWESTFMEKEFLKLLDIDPSKYPKQLTNKTPPPYIENIYNAMSSMESKMSGGLHSGSFVDMINAYPTARALFTRKDPFYSHRHFLVYHIKHVPNTATVTGAELVIPEAAMKMGIRFHVRPVVPHTGHYMGNTEMSTTGGVGQIVLNVTEYLISCVSQKWNKAVFRIDDTSKRRNKFMKTANKESILVIYENVDVGKLKEKLPRMKRDTSQNRFPTEIVDDQQDVVHENVSKTTLETNVEDENATGNKTDAIGASNSSRLSSPHSASTETSDVSGNFSENSSSISSMPINSSSSSGSAGIYCKLHRWTFDFSVVQWSQFMVHPNTFEAGYCKGKCSSPFVHKNTNATNYSFLKNLFHIKTNFENSDVPRATCTPISYYPQTVQYQLPDGEYITRTLAEMRVTACGCR